LFEHCSQQYFGEPSSNSLVNPAAYVRLFFDLAFLHVIRRLLGDDHDASIITVHDRSRFLADTSGLLGQYPPLGGRDDCCRHGLDRSHAADRGALVFEFPWCDDFSAARNESLRHATGDWLFWMDSDDTISIENGQRLRTLTANLTGESAAGFVMQVHCPGPAGTLDVTVVDHVKLFRNRPDFRFEGRIHEQILPAIRRADGVVEWTDIYVTHSGIDHSAAAKVTKQRRDLRLLELDLKDRPEHPFVLFNLGMTYADMEQPLPAIDFLKRSLKAASPHESHVRKAYALLVGCLLQAGANIEAQSFLDRGQALFPNDPELHFRRGIAEQRANHLDKAIESFKSALANREDRHFSSRDSGISGYKARHNLAEIYRQLGRLDHAELHWRLALDDQPHYREGWRGLVETLLAQQKYCTLEIEIEHAMIRGLPFPDIICAKAQLLSARGEVHSAAAVLREHIADESCPLDVLRVKCQLLFENAFANDATGSLEQLCRRCPNDGAAWHNLGTAHQMAKDFRKALSCYERSLEVRPESKLTLDQLTAVRQALEMAEDLASDLARSLPSSALLACEEAISTE